MSALIELETLDISGNEIVGIPDPILSYKRLQVLYLSDDSDAVVEMAEIAAHFPDLHTVEVKK